MTQKKTIITILLILLLLLPIITGCWDRRELEERISVIALSIDRAEPSEKGEPMYLLSVQIPIPIRIAGAAGGGGGQGGQEAVKVISTTGFSVAHALNNLQKRLNQELFLGHTRVIAISEELAREGVADLLDGFRRDPSLRRLLWFLVVEGKAVDLMRSDPKLEQIPMFYILSLLENGARTGNIPDITLGKFYISVSNSGMQPMLNYVRASKDDVSWIGVALFNKEKMIADLNAEESWTLMQLRDENPGGEIFIHLDEEDPAKHFVVRPKNMDTSTKIDIKEGQVKVHYHVYIQADIMEKSFEMDLSKPGNLNRLAKATERSLEKNALKLINDLQHKHKVDALKLGIKIKAFHYQDWQKMDWKEEFPKADFTVSYQVKFRRIGMELN